MSELPGLIEKYFPFGVRIMVVLLEDSSAQPPSLAYCNSYAEKYGLPADKIPVLIDPQKNSQVYYESPVVSLSVITNREGVITYKDEVNNASAFEWQLKYELKQMCNALAEDTEEVYDDYIYEMCQEVKAPIE